MLQNQVYSMQGIGKAGTISRAHLNFKNVIGAVATDDTILAGSFVQLADEHNDNTTTQVKGTNNQTISNPILGIALFEYKSECFDNQHMNFKAGDNISVLTAGNVFIVFENTCKVGDNIFIANSGGGLEATSDETKDGYINTGWRVLKTASTAGNNNIIEITKAL